MAKIRVTLRKDKQNPEGLCPLSLFVRHRGKKSILSLGLSVHPRDWNPSRGEVRRTHPQAQIYNRRLTEAKATGQRLLAEFATSKEAFSAKELRDEVRRALFGVEAPVFDFLEYAMRRLKGYEARGQYGAFIYYQQVLRKLARYCRSTFGREVLPGPEFTHGFLRGFYTWLRTSKAEGGAGNHQKHGTRTSGGRENVLPYGRAGRTLAQ